MYDATTRSTYAQLFKLAEAKLPTAVRDETVKIAAASGEELVAGILKGLWRTP
jgi:hypothetical protein